MLEFDATTHTYTFDGKRLANVTSICACMGKDMPEDDYLDGALDLAADRGVTIHDYIARRLSGEPWSDCIEDVPDAYVPWTESVESFLEEHTITPLMIEESLCVPNLGIAGTLDALCEVDGIITLLDFKCVSAVSKSKIKAQMNLYRMMLEDMEIFPAQMFAIQFTADRYRMYPVAMDYDEAHLCLDVMNARNKKHGKGVID